jgi:hypothetical protein
MTESIVWESLFPLLNWVHSMTFRPFSELRHVYHGGYSGRVHAVFRDIDPRSPDDVHSLRRTGDKWPASGGLNDRHFLLVRVHH